MKAFFCDKCGKRQDKRASLVDFYSKLENDPDEQEYCADLCDDCFLEVLRFVLNIDLSQYR